MALIDNLVTYYKFDTDNATQPDSVSSNDATVQGATFSASGKINNAYDYDGNNDYIDTGGGVDATIEGSGDWTISMWVKPDNTTSNDYQVLIGTIGGGAYTSGFVINLNSGGSGYIVLGLDDGGNPFELVVTFNDTPLTQDVWNHLVIRRDGSSFECFVNTTKDATAGSYAGAVSVGTQNIFLGQAESGRYFEGIIDEVGIWSRAINDAEVSELYNGGVGFQYPFEIWSTPGEENNPVIDPTKTKGTKEVARRYPVASGLTAESTKQEGRRSHLVPEKGSKVPQRGLWGIR